MSTRIRTTCTVTYSRSIWTLLGTLVSLVKKYVKPLTPIKSTKSAITETWSMLLAICNNKLVIFFIKKEGNFKNFAFTDTEEQIRSLMRKETSQAGDIVNWVCVRCNFTSDRAKNLFSHIQSKHVQSGYVCSFCSKYCKTLNALDAHQRRYHKNWTFSSFFWQLTIWRSSRKWWMWWGLVGRIFGNAPSVSTARTGSLTPKLTLKPSTWLWRRATSVRIVKEIVSQEMPLENTLNAAVQIHCILYWEIDCFIVFMFQ